MDVVVRGIVLGAVSLTTIIVLVRIVGLRTFSKMTAFDFVITLATGSLLATSAVSTSWPDFLQALVAISALIGLQVGLALYRKSIGGIRSPLENEPVILVRDGVFQDHAMARTRVSRDDVMAKLRGANVLAMQDVRAVVLETTGDISVLSGDRLEAEILRGVNTADVET
ncbi:DUF421 domain-containing protein [Paracoccus albicereus]|nr:YetF domain-containing protein [Paracoccus albicereus]